MEDSLVQRVKKITLKGLVSDDYLLESLTLKGGNALDMIYKLNQRGSYDLDFSMEGDFTDDLEVISNRIKRTLSEAFFDEGYTIIDFKFIEKPPQISQDMKDFWGGYKIEFKITDTKSYEANKGDSNTLSRRAISLNPETKSSKIEVDISKHEYIGEKERHQIDGLYIYVYAPIMILFEKIRAICQQTKEYQPIVKRDNQKGRARDFYDIYSIMQNCPGIDIYSRESQQLIKNVFEAKKVPIEFIQLIENYKSLHIDNFQVVQRTVSTTELQPFDFYFDYVVECSRKLLDIIKNSPDSIDATP